MSLFHLRFEIHLLNILEIIIYLSISLYFTLTTIAIQHINFYSLQVYYSGWEQSTDFQQGVKNFTLKGFTLYSIEWTNKGFKDTCIL